MKRPNVDSVLAPLKPFQRRTVAHAYRQLFETPGGSGRFLVADEVGLGKTLVARGLIARAIDYYWNRVKRIDIVYICSNQSIALSNLPKLQIADEDDRSFSLATRLTMLATELARPAGGRPLRDSKVNFISFTPGTSFNMGHSGGMAKERRVLFALLDGLVEPRTGLMNLLQGGVTRADWWRSVLKHDPMPLDPDIREQFRERFLEAGSIRAEMDRVLTTWFLRRRRSYPREARAPRNRIIGELRRMLADICVQALQPDLIILDEFQRFKGLLEARSGYADPAAELAQALFNAPAPEGHRARTLLLSATPYKLYTADAEIGREDHFQDFLDTTRFLFDGDERCVGSLQSALRRYGTELKRASQGAHHAVTAEKRTVEDLLSAVMVRTERIMASDDHDAMVREHAVRLKLHVNDVHQYMASDAMFRAVGDFDPLVFWKSAPYLPHFMHGYRFNERLAEAAVQRPNKVASVLKDHARSFLSAEQISAWRLVDPANAKLRELVHDLLDGGVWKLLWIPPSVPYWPLTGAFAGQERRTKTLLFSAWNVVPDVVSGLLSYEAERRMLGGSSDSYENLSDQQAQLLKFTASSEPRTSHRMLLLLMPCPLLADEVHPLKACGQPLRDWARQRVSELLETLPDPQAQAVDERWEWAILRLLDPSIDEFLGHWRDADFDAENPLRPDSATFADYIDDLLAIDAASLGRRPEGLTELVVDLALGAPGVLATRMLAPAKLDVRGRCIQAARLANAFWKLFNRPAVTRLLRQLPRSEEESGKQADPYWHQVIGYCIDGNLQAVLDEYWHLIWEQHAWSAKEDRATISRRCILQMAESVEPRPSRVHANFLQPNGSEIHERVIRLRTVFALRFGRAHSEDGTHSQDAVRAAFNSPFRPFALASTSVGQEGLDFHPWCHRLLHWDLPGNPVDMEQREGRVHRYKGHALRRNVAASYAESALGRWSDGDNLWNLIFDAANDDARGQGLHDLIPYWIATGPFRVERRVPMLPYTRENELFARLQRQLAAYRVVFGQPRQEELLRLLEQSDIDYDDLNAWSIDLSPE